jgi:hypothetical protein
LSISEKEEGRFSPSTMNFDGKAAVTLFTHGGEKLKYGKLVGSRGRRGARRA